VKGYPQTARAIVALAFVLAACSGTQNAAPARPLGARDYFPLHLNAAWSFDSDDMDHPGSPGLVTMRVVRDDGSGGFYMAQGHGPPAVYEYQEGGVTRNGEVVLQSPIQADSRWQGRSHDSYTIRSIGLDRTVTAGTFHNVIEVVRSAGEATLRNGTEYRETFYYAPNVGPIEAIVPIMLPNGDVRRFHLTLRGYTLTGDL
jgi:hypothetical protein